MHKTKSISQAGSSSVRTATLASNFKFEKVEQLNEIVREIQCGKKETVSSEWASRPESGMGEKVLSVLKNRIKTSYEHLYSNYPENKNKILKHIQTVEGNISGENVMKHKQEEVIKEKAKYDKLKATIEEKQRKLKKLMDLKTQLTSGSRNEQAFPQLLQQKLERELQKKEQSKLANSVVAEMLRNRKEVLLNLQKRHSSLAEAISAKREKYQKLNQVNVKRKQLILRLSQSLKQQEPVEIPSRLAEQLSSKLEQYENKYSYHNIIQHEAILQEQRVQRQKKEASAKREELKVIRSKREKQERQQLDQLYQQHSLNSMVQFKLLRLCGAQTIEDLLSSDFYEEKVRLKQLESQIESEIEQVEEECQKLSAEMNRIITADTDSSVQLSSSTLQQQLASDEKNLKLMSLDLSKQRNLFNHWQTIMHLINSNNLNEKALAGVTAHATSDKPSFQQEQGSSAKEDKVPYCYGGQGESIDCE